LYKIGEQMELERTNSASGIDTSGRGEEAGKGCKRVNIVQILCTHDCKRKKDTVEISSSMEERER
jgi:hypothetical protein